MMKIGWNVPGSDFYVPGKYIPGANNYLASPPSVEVEVPEGWSSIEDVLASFPRQEIWHKVKFLVATSKPSLAAFRSAPSLRNSVLTLIPFSEGIFNLYFIQYNETNHNKGYDNDIGMVGPFRIDNTSPIIEDFKIANGSYRIELTNTSLTIKAIDTLSGIDKIYIDGDVKDGVGVREWTDFNQWVDVEISGEFGKKNVTVRVMDVAGNVSTASLGSIFFGATKYFFHSKDTIQNSLSGDSSPLMRDSLDSGILTDTTGNKFETGDEHGNFGSR